MVEQVVSDRLGITWDEFNRRVSHDERFEVVDGELVPLGLTLAGQAVTIQNLYDFLQDRQQVGMPIVHLTYVSEYTAERVINLSVPHVGLCLRSRLQAYMKSQAGWEYKPFLLVPELTAYVVSPFDSYTQVMRKARRYLKDGVKVVWIVDPQLQTVAVHTLGSDLFENLSAEDTLSADDPLPGFAVKVADLFNRD